MRHPAIRPPRRVLPPPDETKDLLRRKAESLGFGAFGITPARPARHGNLFLRWLADGCAGEMRWLEKQPQRRLDPREVFPEARSVIVLGYSYYTGELSPAPAGGGAFARYAWGEDYHRIIEEKLRSLALTLQEMGSECRSYVDTGPVLERDFASEAGLGWNGKSTVQIHRDLGAWFFLAVLFTDLDLPADAPGPDRCGTCTRCIDACPTRAITEPRRLDARRCLSYLTIEHRGPIPEEFRRPMGKRIFGCDDCLAVCPWNRFARESRESRLQAREFATAWSLRQFLSLDDEGFRILFRHSPVKRTKRAGFLRNVCVALGNTGDAEDLPALEKAAADSDPLIAEHARWAMTEIGRRTAETE